MAKRKLFKLIFSVLGFGFIGGGIFVFPSLRQAFASVKNHHYIQHKMWTLIGIYFQKPLFSWLKITLFTAGALLALWMMGKLILSPASKFNGVKRFTKKLKNLEIYKLTKPLTAILMVFLFSLVIINALIFMDSQTNSSNKPNVIFIVCETLRSDHMGYQGYKNDITPHLDNLTQKSYLFQNAYTQTPCTRPSMWNLVTSKYQSSMPAKDAYLTIGEYFKSHHYRTGAFISQQFLKAEKSNLNQGFDIYDDRSPKDKHGLSLRRAASVTDEALKWIKNNPKKPFFTWLVYFDPHDPYIPPPEYRGFYVKSDKYNRDRREDHIHMKAKPVSDEHRNFLINAYDEEIRYFDHEVGRLVENLKKMGVYDNSILIVTSDHGEELGDNGNRWDHCQLLSQEEIWVPLIMKMPGQQEKRVIREAVQNIDVYPTLVDFTEKRPLPSFYITLEGRSLLPLMTQKTSDGTRWAAAFWQGQRCLIKGNHKYWLKKKKESLINIQTMQNLQKKDMLDSMADELSQIYKRYIIKKDYYKETEKRLKSLGYIK